MSEEAEQSTAVQQDPTPVAPVEPAAPASGLPGNSAAPKRRAGIPVWRVGKPDPFLAAAVTEARAAVEGITVPGAIGPHLAAKSEGDRLVTHLFESRLAGYQGWQWYAVLTRNSRSKVVTVSELGMVPSEESILAPEWVPWAERVRPEDAQEHNAGDQDASVAPAAVAADQVPDQDGEDHGADSPEGAEPDQAAGA